ncbi:ATPase AAA [Bombiscardovia apis]|uniref:ATPase AAA n=1 Tax=Bombiscardovia apis TaxID=2932182 RepID=A0ABM8BBE1_9BIFI|nr:ATP-binding protein [Bombiscardovia apis]BDR54238.1 ATPase AAA [Bombiscardovia apis]
MSTNPFKPTAGHLPPLLVGREPIIADFEEGLADGPGAPGRLMCVTGARGVGKTVILTEFGNIAKSHHWEVLDETASSGLAERLVERLQPTKRQLATTIKPEITGPQGIGASLGQISISSQQMPLTLREALTHRLNKIEKRSKDRGLLVTVDETQAADRNDLVAIATAVQHLIRENRNIAFVFAGLPTITSKWLNDELLTFLRRAQPERLADVPLPEVETAFSNTFAQSGITLAGNPLTEATEATQGYPFMIQLVGYNIWRVANRHAAENPVVTEEDASKGIEDARRRLGNTVHGPELDGLSQVDRTYLLAMAKDDGPSFTAEIAKRLKQSQTYANIYRTRLLDGDFIKNAGWGRVDFAIPYLRQYLREHDAYYMQQE